MKKAKRLKTKWKIVKRGLDNGRGKQEKGLEYEWYVKGSVDDKTSSEATNRGTQREELNKGKVYV